MADYNLTYTGAQVNAAIGAVTTALNNGGIQSVNSFNNTIANYSTTIQMNTKISSLYPVGAVYMTSTNTNPGTFLGGTWTLIDKEFAYHNIDSFTPTLNSTNCSGANVQGHVVGHTITIVFNFTIKKAIDDNTYTMFTIPMANFGVQSDWLGTVRFTHFSDGGQVVLAMLMNASGEVQVLDLLQRNNTSASLSAGQGISYQTIHRTVPASRMLDSWCDRFYWKRTA